MRAAASALPTLRITYTSCVIDGFACPRYSSIARALRPAVSSSVAQVLRSPWLFRPG